MYKNLVKSLLYFFLILSILLLLYTILNYFNILFNNNYIILIITFISVFISSFILGRNTIKNGYLEGIKFGAIIILIFLFLSFIFACFQFKSIIYYFIILLISILGSMLGINLKKVAV